MQEDSTIQLDDWQQIHAMIFRFFRKRVHDESDAEDLTQEVLLKVHQHITSRKVDGQEAKGPDNPSQWLYRIARNTLIDGYRRHSTAISAKSQLKSHAGQLASARAADDAAQRLEGSEGDEALRAEVASWIGAFIQGLPGSYKDALEAVDLGGMSQKAYGAAQGMSYSGVKSRVQRGRQMLKERLLACCQLAFDSRGSIIDVKANASPQGAPPGCCNRCGPADDLPNEPSQPVVDQTT